jgi:hypothetical protein
VLVFASFCGDEESYMLKIVPRKLHYLTSLNVKYIGNLIHKHTNIFLELVCFGSN